MSTLQSVEGGRDWEKKSRSPRMRKQGNATPLCQKKCDRKVLLWRTGKLSLGNKGEELQSLGFT